jgi:kinesin family protein 2/24
MSSIQENAELLTEEGRLLQQMQGDSIEEASIDTYADKLEAILGRKEAIIEEIQQMISTL